MPRRIFTYSKEAGEVVEITDDSVKQLCDEIHEDAVSRSDDALSPGKRHCTASCWPRHSEAMAVNPKDIKRAQAILAEKGITCNYDEHGRPELRDKKHEREYMACMGYYHRNAGYSDRAPEHFTMDYHPDNKQKRIEEFVRNLQAGRLF